MTYEIDKISTKDFTITADGEGYISQTKIAELTGIPRGTLQGWLKSGTPSCAIKVNESNQIHYSALPYLVESGTLKGYSKCIPLLSALAKAGAKAYIYHLAGYTMTAEPEPLTEIEIARKYLANLEALEVKKAEVDQLQVTLDKQEQWSSIKKQERLTRGNYAWQPLKKYSRTNGIEIKKAFDQNYGYVNSYSAETWLNVYEVKI